MSITKESTAKQDDALSPSGPGEPDWLLQTFVDEANGRNGEFLSVTLLVGGLIISGILVGASEYLRAIANTFIKNDEPPQEGTWGKWLLDRADEFTVKETNAGDLAEATYIHLKDARLHSNDRHPLPTNEGVWWRGRLSSVDAFWIGRLRVPSEE